MFNCVWFDPSGRGIRSVSKPEPEHGRSGHPTGSRSGASSTQSETLDDRAVAVDVGLVQVVQQPTTLAHEEQQATTRVVVVLVLLEVLGQVADAVAEQRDLDLGRTGVALLGRVLGDDLLLGLRVGTDRHAGSFRPRGLRCCAARRGLFTRALSIRGRSTATGGDYQRAGVPPKTTEAPAGA